MQINLGDASLEQVLERLLAMRSNLPWGGMLGIEYVASQFSTMLAFFPSKKVRRCVLPHPPPPPPELIVLQMGEGGWRVVYSTRTASRVHVLFFPCLHVLS